MLNRLRNLILVALVIIAAVAFIRFRMESPAVAASSSPNQETAVIDQGDILMTVSASGAIQARQSASLTFTATGKVATLNVNQGDHVQQGQTIATLDSQTQLDALLLAQVKVDSVNISLRRLTDTPRPVDVAVYKAALALAQSQLYEALHSIDPKNAQIAQIQVDSAKNALYLQQLNRDADQKLKNDLLKNPWTAGQAAIVLPSDTAENAQLTGKEYDVQIAQSNASAAANQSGNVGSIGAAQAQVTTAQNALDKFVQGGDAQDIARVQASLQAAQTALAQARSNLAKTKLTAPFDGVIAKLNLHVGEQLPLGPAAVLLDTSSFYVDLPIDEVDIAKIALGQAVNLKFDSLPGAVLPGKVSRVGTIGDKSGSVVTYTVRVEVDPTGQPLLSSMTATTTIITGKVSSAVRIPNRFVRVDRSTGKTYATRRQTDGKLYETEIVLGLRNDTLSEVKSGLQAGDVVYPPQSQSKILSGSSNSGADTGS